MPAASLVSTPGAEDRRSEPSLALTARTARGGKAMTRPGSSIPDAEQREGPMLDTAEGLAKSPWCAVPGNHVTER